MIDLQGVQVVGIGRHRLDRQVVDLDNVVPYWVRAHAPERAGRLRLLLFLSVRIPVMLAHGLIVEASSLLLLAWAVGRLVKLLFQALLFLLKAFLRRLLVLGFFRLRDRECKPVDLAALLRGLLVPLLEHDILLVFLLLALLVLLLNTGPKACEAATCLGFARLRLLDLLRLLRTRPQGAEITGLLAGILGLRVGLTGPECSRVMRFQLLVAAIGCLGRCILLNWRRAAPAITARIRLAVNARRFAQWTLELVRLVLEAASELFA